MDAGAGYRLRLSAARFTEDLPVSGSVHWTGRSGEVSGRLVLGGAGSQEILEVSWPEGVPAARATVRGTLGGKAVVAEAPAP